MSHPTRRRRWLRLPGRAGIVAAVAAATAAIPAQAAHAATVPAGSDSCAAPTVVTGNGTSTGSTAGLSDKHQNSWADAVNGVAPDAVWQFTIGQTADIDIADSGSSAWTHEIVLSHAPDGSSQNACGTPSADFREADNLWNQPTWSIDMNVTGLSPGTYLVWVDGDNRYTPNSGSYALTFSFSSPPQAAPAPTQGGGTASPAGADTTRRLGSSDDPDAAAIGLSQGEWADHSAKSVVLGRDDVFADALGGDALAGTNGPVLYTTGGSSAPIRQDTLAEIERVLPAAQSCSAGAPQVYILGGTAAVSQAAQDALTQAGYCIKRFSGSDRVDTSVQLASYLASANGGGGTVLLSRMDNWADAATGGAYAAATGDPILVTPSTSLDSRVASFLGQYHPQKIVVLGGNAAVSDGVASQAGQYGSVTRVAGASRDSTATAIASQLWGSLNPTGVVEVPGFATNGWVYALAGAVDAAREGAVELYVQTTGLTADDQSYLSGHPFSFVVADGPTDLVTDQTWQQAQSDEHSGSSPSPTPTPAHCTPGTTIATSCATTGGTMHTVASQPIDNAGPNPCPTNLQQYWSGDASVPQGMDHATAGVTDLGGAGGCRLQLNLVTKAGMSNIAFGYFGLDTDGNTSDGCEGAELVGYFNSQGVVLEHTNGTCDQSAWTDATDVDAFGSVDTSSVTLNISRADITSGTRLVAGVVTASGANDEDPFHPVDVTD